MQFVFNVLPWAVLSETSRAAPQFRLFRSAKISQIIKNQKPDAENSPSEQKNFGFGFNFRTFDASY
ncbi:hypothetical protein EAI98_10775 [Alistipes finegoldii]|nr:hypothetical protein EAI98_10775 [Alistipes finegoldii]